MSETQTASLTAFLLRRIAEDEAEFAPRSVDLLDPFEPPSDAQRRVRVLAECEASRRIVEAHPRSLALDYCETCFSGDYGHLDEPLHEDWPCPTLRALTLPFADHPDFRAEWRP